MKGAAQEPPLFIWVTIKHSCDLQSGKKRIAANLAIHCDDAPIISLRLPK
jgi:hypothetical protein